MSGRREANFPGSTFRDLRDAVQVLVLDPSLSTAMSTPVDKEGAMADQRLVRELQTIIDSNDTVGALRIIVGELKLVFDKHDGIHPSPYNNHVTALLLALEEVHPS